jgi:hypothetical protein
MWRIRYALEQGDRLRALPALARDAGASLVVLAAFGAAASLPFVAVPAAALVLLPVLLFTAVLFGRDSALLAALLAALMARFGAAEGAAVGLLPIAVLSAAALAMAALVEELRRSRAEAEMAHFRVETIARRAAERMEAARRLAREADERLVEAERRAFGAATCGAVASPSPPHANAPDPAMESAFRSEGGI